MELKELLEETPYTILQGDLEKEITGIARDTREIKEGDLFICIEGANYDTHTMLQEIADSGAAAIVIERPLNECSPLNSSLPVLLVPNSRKAEGEIAAKIYNHPSRKLTLIGVTGSKGKTTVTHMLANILRADGKKVGTIGTNGVNINDQVIELNNTTPTALEIHKYLSEMVDNDIEVAIVECSSQGLKQYRTSGLEFDYGVFLNIATGDHIGPNEHDDFADYLFSKGLLLKQSQLGFVNQDDPWTKKLLKDISTPIITFGDNKNSDYYKYNEKKIFNSHMPQQTFSISGKKDIDLLVNLPGDFNLWNALAAVSVANEMKASTEAIKEALSHLEIKGRGDIVFNNDYLTICVDFAHNGVSTRNHLKSLREFHPKRLVCIFGADGNRSKNRRYEMGEASGNLADFSIITSGHNRWETFDDISKDILVGMKKTSGSYIVIPDRKEAISYALKNAQEGDFITILGLGHETYQEENGIKHHYSDREYVKEVLKELNIIRETNEEEN